MRALPILAALICTAPLAKSSTTELELLQSRCQEQERQIRQLEEENSRLKSLVSTASKTPAPAQAATSAPATSSTKTESKKEDETSKSAPAKSSDAASYGIVRAGDTLNKLAKRHRTSPEALAELNNLKKPFLIRAGQRLRLPEAPAPTAKAKDSATAKASPEGKPTARPHGGTHKIKAGDTFFSISRHYGMSQNALQAANPGVKSTSLRIGQTLQLGGKPAATKSTAKSSEVDAVAKSSSGTPKHEVASSKATESSKPAAETKAAAAPEASAPAPAPAPADQPVVNGSRIRTVAIEETTPLSSFAAAHGTSIARLNALNGLNLNSSTVLAKGSELYVPAQP